MPTYDFTCTDCGETFERRLSMSAYGEGEGRECPCCGSQRVERAWNAVNVITDSSRGGSTGPTCGPGGFT
jgi:putative FmdB family regulatory protein